MDGPDDGRLMQYLAAFWFWAWKSLSRERTSRAPLWYEDNNLGEHGGYPADFLAKFSDPRWLECSKYLDVYQIGLSTLRRFPDTFLTDTFLPYLRDNGISLALDVEGATWTQLDPGREGLVIAEMAQLQWLSFLNAPVSHISLQSALSKNLPGSKNYDDYPLWHRINDIRSYLWKAKTHFPEAKYGLIDASPTHGMNWRKMYHQLFIVNKIDYLHLDAPYAQYVRGPFDSLSWHEIDQVRRFLRARQVEFGLLLTSQTGSNAAFVADVKVMAREAVKYLGPEVAGIVISWFPYPNETVPMLSDLLTWLGQQVFCDDN